MPRRRAAAPSQPGVLTAAEETTTRRMRGGWVDPDTLPRDALGRTLCRWCGQAVHPPRLTFCSAACVHEHRMRTSGSYMRAYPM